MAEFVMPRLGADMDFGTLVEWRKQPGERIERGEIMAEIETDKGEIEVESFTSGTVERLLATPGDHVPVGTPLATIVESGHHNAVSAAAAARHAVSPAARKLAAQVGVDPTLIAGTGPRGRVVFRDIQAAASARRSAPETPTPAESATTPPARAIAEKPDRMRHAIAAAMARSKREIPHFYARTTIDMSTPMTWLAEENERRPLTERLLYGVLLIKAVAMALHDSPALNATWHDDRVIPSQHIHVGVAVSLRGGGLIAPALHDADKHTLDELMHDFRDLVNRTRRGGLRGSELSDPTITITSLGERGAEEVYGVIVPPQVAIVGFGAVVERPWVSNGAVLPCPVVTATVSADHRAIDGHQVSRFLGDVDRLLQEPEDL